MTEHQRKPVVFIAGPMTGYLNFNRDEFNSEAGILKDLGFTVLNPAILPDGLQHSEYLTITLAMLEVADSIFILNGWEKSEGANIEMKRARELGLIFMYQSWETAKNTIQLNRQLRTKPVEEVKSHIAGPEVKLPPQYCHGHRDDPDSDYDAGFHHGWRNARDASEAAMRE